MSKEGAKGIWVLLFIVISFAVAGSLPTIIHYGATKGTVILILSVLFCAAIIYYFMNE